MTFPVYIHLGFLTIHPHLLFETLAYFVGFRVYLYTRNKEKMPINHALAVIAGAAVGAAIGSKLLYWFEDPWETFDHITDPYYLMAGKTIVGGLLGGLIGVETAKKLIGWSRSTGDDFTLPLIVGMSIGRIGCFLTGLSDHTYGMPTNWITGVDFGDGIPRHPTQLYEIVVLCGIAIILTLLNKGKRTRSTMPDGGRFQLFMFGYLCFRFGIDFIKPTPHPYAGLNNVQLACLLGLAYYSLLLIRWRRRE